jgi:hypothetical protein
MLITGVLSLFWSFIFIILSGMVQNFTSVLLTSFTWGSDYPIFLHAYLHLDLHSYFYISFLYVKKPYNSRVTFMA